MLPILAFILDTRSYAALRAEDLDWIVGPWYSLGRVHSWEKPTWNHDKPTWNHEKPWKPTKNHEKPWNYLEKPWKPTKNHEKPWNYLEKPWKLTKNHEKPWKYLEKPWKPGRGWGVAGKTEKRDTRGVTTDLWDGGGGGAGISKNVTHVGSQLTF